MLRKFYNGYVTLLLLSNSDHCVYPNYNHAKKENLLILYRFQDDMNVTNAVHALNKVGIYNTVYVCHFYVVLLLTGI